MQTIVKEESKRQDDFFMIEDYEFEYRQSSELPEIYSEN